MLTGNVVMILGSPSQAVHYFQPGCDNFFRPLFNDLLQRECMIAEVVVISLHRQRISNARNKFRSINRLGQEVCSPQFESFQSSVTV